MSSVLSIEDDYSTGLRWCKFHDASLSCVDIDLLILSTMLTECKARADIPNPEERFARLVVPLHDPLAWEQQAAHILTVLCYLAPLFPENINLFWQEEIPK